MTRPADRKQSKRRPLRLRTRLLAALAVPLIGLTVFAQRYASDRRVLAHHAAIATAHGTQVRALVLLRDRFIKMRMGSQGVAEAAALGIDAQAIAKMVGLDLPAMQADGGRAMRSSIEELGLGAVGDPSSLTEATAEALQRALQSSREQETLFTSGRGDLDALRDAYDAFDDLTLVAIAEELGLFEQAASNVRGTKSLAALVRGTRDTITALDAASSELQSYFNLLTPDNLQGGVREVIFERDLFSMAAQTLQRELPNDLSTAWRARVDTPQGRRFHQALQTRIDAAINGEEPPELATQIEIFNDGMTWSQSLSPFINNIIEAVSHLTNDVEQEARREANLVTAAAIFMVTMSLVVTVLTIRSINAPLRRLETQAHRVRNGDLDIDALTRTGPTEVAVVTAAFVDMVDNLRSFEAQAEALSNVQLDAPILSQRLPGRFGASLKASVDRLTETTARLEHQAKRDSLTEIANRLTGVDHLTRILGEARAERTATGVLFVDLDRFKLINDRHGHAAGDAVLRTCASRLVNCVGPRDLVARLGGDEFVVLCSGRSSVEEVVSLAELLRVALSAPIELDGHRVIVSTSFGVAWSNDSTHDADELLHQADLALYRAKSLGRDQVAVYDEQLEASVHERVQMQRSIETALVLGEFELHYQPVLAVDSSRLDGVEALIRWNRPGSGLVSPGEFLPIAEESHLIVDIGRWVLRTAASQVAGWSREAWAQDLSVAVNISARHLTSGRLIGDIRDALEVSGLDPRRLVIEITETQIVGDPSGASAVLSVVRSMGVRVVIDDFGAGHSSIARLRELPIDGLKIDRSIVSMLADRRDRSLAELVIGFAAACELSVVAEGIETESQRSVLASLHCPFGQGFLFARPMPAALVAGWALEHCSPVNVTP